MKIVRKVCFLLVAAKQKQGIREITYQYILDNSNKKTLKGKTLDLTIYSYQMAEQKGR